MKRIVTKYHGPTNHRGARISANDGAGHRVVIAYPYELSGEAVHRAAAQALCEKHGWTDKLHGFATTPGYVFIIVDEAHVVTFEIEAQP